MRRWVGGAESSRRFLPLGFSSREVYLRTYVYFRTCTYVRVLLYIRNVRVLAHVPGSFVRVLAYICYVRILYVRIDSYQVRELQETWGR